jgi:uncharacterized protein YdaU (DUF1376 family)
MHYYQFNIGDYASHTGYLTQMEDLGYRRLLDLYYLHEKPLTNDIPHLCRVVGMREFEAEITQVLSDFFYLDGGEWRNKRVDEEIASYRAKADTARTNGQKGGRPKGSNKPRITQPVILANPEETGSKAKHKPLTINQEPVKENTSSSTKADPIPYQQIVDSYHRNLPMLPGVQKLTDARKRHIKARWSEVTKDGKDIGYFDRFFDHVSHSDFLKTGSFCNLEWLMKESNHVKVIEGNYHNE